MIPAGISSQRYRIVTAMNAPLPRPRMMTASGSKQQSDDSRAPSHAVTPGPTALALMAPSGMPRGSDRSATRQTRRVLATQRDRRAPPSAEPDRSEDAHSDRRKA